MELGEKLLLARQEAGLSQRQLCGDRITRNMLSQIEHGTARPSMDTLRYLASRLGKPIGYFLEEDAVASPNQKRMEQARAAFARGDHAAVLELLEQYEAPDPVYDWEQQYRKALSFAAAAEQALAEQKNMYARELLERGEEAARLFPELERQRRLLLGKIPGSDLTAVVSGLPPVDEELMLRAEEVLIRQDGKRALALLEAVEDRTAVRWKLLKGQALLGLCRYEEAAAQLKEAEMAHPSLCYPLLEICFRELGDFQQAYVYACRQR